MREIGRHDGLNILMLKEGVADGQDIASTEILQLLVISFSHGFAQSTDPYCIVSVNSCIEASHQ